MSLNVTEKSETERELYARAGMPQFCDIIIATHYVLQCKMCKAWHAPADGPHLTFDESRHFVDSLAEFVTTPLEINVMGGEPLLIPWCLDLCSYIAEKGFKSIISTNAWLIDEDMAKRIADSNLSVLAISLESMNPEVHDYYRGKEGVHQKVMQAIEYLDKYCRGKLPITILSIIMEKNLNEIVPLAQWVNQNSLFENISYLALLETGLVSERKNWFKQDVYKDLWPQDKAHLDAIVDELIDLRKRGCKIWNPLSQLNAFKEYYEEPDLFMRTTPYKIRDLIIDIDEKGSMYLSGEALGDIRTDNLRELWYSEKANVIREKIRTKGPGKRCCVINFVCAFPSDVEYLNEKNETGSFNQSDGVHDQERVICEEKNSTDIKETSVALQSEESAEEKKMIRKPRFGIIEVIRSCPLRCKMCNNWKADPIQGLITIDEMKRYISCLADFVDRPFEINLAGGEPLLRKDIFDLIHHIVSYNFTVSLTTGGYTLNKSVLKKVISSGLTLMPISLDSLNKDLHDFLRGRRGTFKKAMKAFSFLLKDRGCLRNLTVQTIVMKPNLDEITTIVKWAHERDIAVSLMAIMRPNGVHPDPYWFKQGEYSFLWPDNPEEVGGVIDEVITLKQAGYRIDNEIEQLEAFKEYYHNPTVFLKDGPCSLGDGIVNVAPDGNIYLCWEMEPLGNIKHDDICEIWYSERATRLRDAIMKCKRNCSAMVNCFFES